MSLGPISLPEASELDNGQLEFGPGFHPLDDIFGRLWCKAGTEPAQSLIPKVWSTSTAAKGHKETEALETVAGFEGLPREGMECGVHREAPPTTPRWEGVAGPSRLPATQPRCPPNTECLVDVHVLVCCLPSSA